MKKPPYVLTAEDQQIIGSLLLELAVELDLHYEDEDMHALKDSFALIREGICLLNRLSFDVHPDVHAILARYAKRTSEDTYHEG